MAIEPIIKQQILTDWKAAPYGEKTNILTKWAGILGCSYKTLSRQLDTGRRREKGQRRIDQIEEYVHVVFRIKKKPPEQMGEITTEQAIRIAVDNGLIPESMLDRVSTFDRIGRELGMKKGRRIQRFQAEYPNQLHHVDASSSKCFYIKSQLSNGDYLLCLHSGTKGYKNKPVPIRLRPWIYGIVDDYSGVWAGRYVAAYGETAIDNLAFLAWAWGKSENKAFFGLPEKIKGDLGPMMRGVDANDFFERLSITIDPSLPENKDSHGKIERPWRTAWQRFEKPFFAQSDWKKFEITLSELNRQFLIYQQEYNERPHRYETNKTRIQAWKQINFHGGAVEMPEKALSTVAKRFERVVGADGCFSINNVIYEVKGLHRADVYVYQGVFENKMVVIDKATGGKFEVEHFEPNPLGTFKASKETEHQKTRKEALQLEITNTLYNKSKENGKVASLPTRIKENRAINNYFDVGTYRSLEEAMMEFTSICGIRLREDARKTIQTLITKNGLSRQFVTDLALEVQRDLQEQEDQIQNERMLKHG